MVWFVDMPENLAVFTSPIGPNGADSPSIVVIGDVCFSNTMSESGVFDDIASS